LLRGCIGSGVTSTDLKCAGSPASRREWCWGGVGGRCRAGPEVGHLVTGSLSIPCGTSEKTTVCQAPCEPHQITFGYRHVHFNS
jgi:hypothetical protein